MWMVRIEVLLFTYNAYAMRWYIDILYVMMIYGVQVQRAMNSKNFALK